MGEGGGMWSSLLSGSGFEREGQLNTLKSVLGS